MACGVPGPWVHVLSLLTHTHTLQVDVFEFDLLLIPVHMGMHWCLAAVDFSKKHISYYDSLHGSNEPCLQRLRYTMCIFFST